MKTAVREQLEGLIEEFGTRRWDGESIRRAICLDREEPGFLGQLLAEAILRVPTGGRFLDILLSVLPEESWPALVTRAVEQLSVHDRLEAAIQIVQQGMFQQPAALHPHLHPIFRMEQQWAYGFIGAFREANGSSIRFLFEACGQGDRAQRRLACQALLETRQPHALAFAQVHGRGFTAYLPEIGFEQSRDGFRKLYTDRVFHLAFPAPYLDRLPPEVTQRKQGLRHPTWTPLSLDASIHSLGGMSGTLCPGCGRRVPRLILLDPVPPGLGVTGLSRLELVACVACLEWTQEVVHYQHAPDGAAEALPFRAMSLLVEEASSLGWADPVPEEMAGKPDPTSTLAECAVALVELAPRWRWQDWGAGQNLHRFGGHPVWIEGATYPSCPGCGQTSAFVCQLDSDLRKGDGRAFRWGEGGIGYVFFCDRCKISSVLWQCL